MSGISVCMIGQNEIWGQILNLIIEHLILKPNQINLSLLNTFKKNNSDQIIIIFKF